MCQPCSCPGGHPTRSGRPGRHCTCSARIGDRPGNSPRRTASGPQDAGIDPTLEQAIAPQQESLSEGTLSEEDLQAIMPEVSTLIESLFHLLTKAKEPSPPAEKAVQIENPGAIAQVENALASIIDKLTPLTGSQTINTADDYTINGYKLAFFYHREHGGTQRNSLCDLGVLCGEKRYFLILLYYLILTTCKYFATKAFRHEKVRFSVMESKNEGTIFDCQGLGSRGMFGDAGGVRRYSRTF